MPSRPLTPEVALNVHLSAICTRSKFTRDPGSVIAELRAMAGERTDILAEVAGRVAGYYDGEHTRTLCAALRAEIDGAEAWVAVGKERRSMEMHGTSGYLRTEQPD